MSDAIYKTVSIIGCRFSFIPALFAFQHGTLAQSVPMPGRRMYCFKPLEVTPNMPRRSMRRGRGWRERRPSPAATKPPLSRDSPILSFLTMGPPQAYARASGCSADDKERIEGQDMTRL